MTNRNQELANGVLADLAEMGTGPGTNVPLKTIWLRGHDRGVVVWSELHAALTWAIEEAGYLTYAPGGIAGLGSIALTDDGYERSRAL